MNDFEVILPHSDLVFRFTDKGLYFGDSLMSSSITNWFPDTIIVTPKNIKIVTNIGYVEISDVGIGVREISQEVFR